jgi:hypothetical protein
MNLNYINCIILKDQGLKCFCHTISSMLFMFGAFYILVPFLSISPLSKKLAVIGLQLRSDCTK